MANHDAPAELDSDRARLAYAVRLSGIGFWYCDLPFDRLVWDAHVKAHFWVPPDADVDIALFYERLHPDDRAPTREATDAAIANREPYDVRYRTVDPASGAIKWIRALGGATYDDDGRPVRFDGVTVDVTAQMRDEQALRRLAARQAFELDLSDRIRSLTAPIDIMAEASAVLGERLDAARVVYLEIDREQAMAIVQRDWARPGIASLAGQRFRIDDFGESLGDELRAGQTVVCEDVVADPRTAVRAHLFAQIDLRSQLVVPLVKEGRVVAVLATHDARPRHWTDEEHVLAHSVVERTWAAVEAVRAQAALRAERDLSRTIFDALTEGFVLLDRAWTIRYINDIGVQLTQRPREALIGRYHWTVVPEAMGTDLERLYRGVAEHGRPDTLEFHYAPAGGTPVWMEVRAYPVPDGQLAVFFRDVSDRKRAEQDARDADRRKDEFLAMLAHELRNPLAPIRAAAELLSMTQLDEARLRQTSAIISRQVGHMTGLVDDLLDVSRVTRGLVELDRHELDVGRVVAAAVEQARPLLSQRHHTLSLQLPAESIVVDGDEKRLVQVVSNLLANAAKYTPEGGHVRVDVTADGGDVVLKVSDDGIGMTPALVDRVFELFAQGERTPDRTQGGLGIGLALVRSLVELHGGRVQASSAGPGEGSTFQVRLPRVAVAARDEPARADVASMPRSTHAPRTVLVVDNTDAATTLAMVLETLGYRCLVAHDGEGGLECALAERPDACVLDIGLPGMDGFELARRLKDDPATQGSLLVAVTGYGQTHDRCSAMEAGFDHYLVKPPDIQGLAELLATRH